MSKRLATNDDYHAIAIALLSRIKKRPMLLCGFYGGDRERFLKHAIMLNDSDQTIDVEISMETDAATAEAIVELQETVRKLARLDDGHDRWRGVLEAIHRATTDDPLA